MKCLTMLLYSIMNKLDYIAPMIVGVILFAAALQQQNAIVQIGMMSISLLCIFVAIDQHSDKE